MQFILYIAVSLISFAIGFALNLRFPNPKRRKRIAADKYYFDSLRYYLKRMTAHYSNDCALNPNCSREFKRACEIIRELMNRLGQKTK